MAITNKEAEILAETWGDKPCTHPSFEKEFFVGEINGQEESMKTGDYICTQCGRVFTRKEKEEIEEKRMHSDS